MSLTDNLLEVNNLYKSYYTLKDELKVLDNISFKVYENDFIGIIGPSGCGKSSILNILAKLDNEFNGDLKYRDNIKIGYMLQEDALFDWLNIYENAIIGLKIKKILNKENVRYVNNLLMKYNLYEFKNKYPCELSGGMKQRLALIRTLAIKPDILLLDEPYCALDYHTRLKVSNDVFNILKEENKTAIIVTHDIEEAISMCNKIIVLSNRPAHIKRIYDIELEDKSSPIENRKCRNFSYYYELLWKEIDV
ncbi:MAG: ATP-binding cassette domain-containing protein [Bacilli bacterium]|nr:ATP-binding cassette domain-containing protein [Bacilli bacterium]